jgi:sarcosine oxidase gamma subunit
MEIFKFGNFNSCITQDTNIVIQDISADDFEIIPYTSNVKFLNSFWEYFEGRCLDGSLNYCIDLIKEYYTNIDKL